MHSHHPAPLNFGQRVSKLALRVTLICAFQHNLEASHDESSPAYRSGAAAARPGTDMYGRFAGGRQRRPVVLRHVLQGPRLVSALARAGGGPVRAAARLRLPPGCRRGSPMADVHRHTPRGEPAEGSWVSAFEQLGQVIILLSGGLSIWMTQAGREGVRRFACVVGMVGQPWWLWSAWSHAQWGQFAVSVLITFAWLRGVLRLIEPTTPAAAATIAVTATAADRSRAHQVRTEDRTAETGREARAAARRHTTLEWRRPCTGLEGPPQGRRKDGVDGLRPRDDGGTAGRAAT